MNKSAKVDGLVTKLLGKFTAEGSNLARKELPFLAEANELKKRAPFLEIADYLYFLAEMSTLILQLNDGSYVTCYGVDDWDDGMNILDFQIPEADGFHMFMDICNPEGELLFFAYDSKQPKTDLVWVAADNEPEPRQYQSTGMGFASVLELILEEKILEFFHRTPWKNE
jgi:hypothetical protein